MAAKAFQWWFCSRVLAASVASLAFFAGFLAREKRPPGAAGSFHLDNGSKPDIMAPSYRGPTAPWKAKIPENPGK